MYILRAAQMGGINILIWRVREYQVNVRGDGERTMHEKEEQVQQLVMIEANKVNRTSSNMMKKRILWLYFLQPGKGGTTFISMCTPLWIPIVMRDHIVSGRYRIVSIVGAVMPNFSRTSSVLMLVTSESLRRSVQRMDKRLFFHQWNEQRFIYTCLCYLLSSRIW